MPRFLTGVSDLYVPLNDLQRSYGRHAVAIESAVLAVLRSGSWLNGKRTDHFARQFAELIGARYCLPVANGTDALEIALRALLIEAGPERREVAVVANAGGYASAACRRSCLVPVYVDVEETSQLMDLGEAVEAVGERTLAVVATHLYGKVVDIDSLREALDRSGHSDIPIVEDCAQASGASLRGRRVGSLGTVATFSFFPTKNLGAAGDAGAILTSDPTLADTMRRLHQYGWSPKYFVTLPGGQNSRMDEIQAAILAALLPGLDEMNAERGAIFQRYLDAAPRGVRVLARSPGEIVHLAVALCSERESFRSYLKARNIATDVHYPVLDIDQPGWLGLPCRTSPGDLNVSRSSVGKIVTLPCFAGMTEREIDLVAGALKDWGSHS